MAKIKEIMFTSLTIISTVGTIMSVDYSKYDKFFSHWNWSAIIIGLFVGIMVMGIFYTVNLYIKDGIKEVKTLADNNIKEVKTIIKDGIQKEYDTLKISVKDAVNYEMRSDMSKLCTNIIEQNETYKKLDDVFKKLDESQDFWRNRQLTAYKIVRDLIVNKTFPDSEKQKQYVEYMGKFFSEYLYVEEELEKFQLQKDIFIEFKRLKHIKEINKLENEKNNS